MTQKLCVLSIEIIAVHAYFLPKGLELQMHLKKDFSANLVRLHVLQCADMPPSWTC